MVSHPLLDSPLTPREIEVSTLVGRGLSSDEIASMPFITLHTVTWHYRRIYRKLGINRRQQLIDLYSQGDQ